MGGPVAYFGNIRSTSFETLDNDRLMRIAPSIFAQHASEKTSSRYAFIPTIEVVEAMRKEGFYPVNAMQSRSRTPEGKSFAKHLIRFRQDSDKQIKVGDSLAEIVVTNSHNGASAYNIMMGLFRLACLNGMVTPAGKFGEMSIRHTGDAVRDVIEASYQVMSDLPQLAGHVDNMRSTILSKDEQLHFAEAALELKYGTTTEEGETEEKVEKAPINPEQLLTTRRQDDRRETSLWTTFNVLQENLLRGGLQGYSTQGGPIRHRWNWQTRSQEPVFRKVRTREVKSVNENIRLNRALWTLTQKMQDLKAAQA
jgi:hypothetical protein